MMMKVFIEMNISKVNNWWNNSERWIWTLLEDSVKEWKHNHTNLYNALKKSSDERMVEFGEDRLN